MADDADEGGAAGAVFPEFSKDLTWCPVVHLQQTAKMWLGLVDREMGERKWV